MQSNGRPNGIAESPNSPRRINLLELLLLSQLLLKYKHRKHAKDDKTNNGLKQESAVNYLDKEKPGIRP
ncbi:hypothetical protein FACS1894186_1760 [Alphaproteobacteria bacterium]|nr:hypothetical protein FACS1894186_1760 [Alphaproteobacteria bacterium]